MIRRTIGLAILGWLASVSFAVAADPKTVFEARTYESPNGGQLKYRLMMPENYDSKQKYPLVLFLHGAGERGDDNTVQLVHGMKDFASDENRAKYPCFVLAPQCPNGKKWAEVDWGADTHKTPAEASDPMRLTLEVIAGLEKQFSIDPKRLYVTGLSMGGYGTWDLISRKPNMFAAAIPICGGGDETEAAKISKIPIWVFHGDKDGAVKVERSRRMVKAIEAEGGKPKYTEYAGVGHDSWSRTYADPNVFEWLFSQKRTD
jgi:predicted peptidase